MTNFEKTKKMSVEEMAASGYAAIYGISHMQKR